MPRIGGLYGRMIIFVTTCARKIIWPEYAHMIVKATHNALNDIGERLRLVLSLNRWSIKDLERRSGIQYRTLQAYLSGDRKPGADHLVNLAGAGIDLHWLLLGQEEAALKLMFPDFEPLTGPLAADSDLAASFLHAAMENVDRWHQGYVESTGSPLSTSLLLTGVWSVFSLYDRLLDEIRDKIIDVRKKGMASEGIAEFILTSPVREAVRERLRVIDPSAKSDSQSPS